VIRIIIERVRIRVVSSSSPISYNICINDNPAYCLGFKQELYSYT
jgi:hypothetical protein